MTNQEIVELIRCHKTGSEEEFDRMARTLATRMLVEGDEACARQILELIGDPLAAAVSADRKSPSAFVIPLGQDENRLQLPEDLKRQIKGIVAIVRSGKGLHRFLFTGGEGTGKTAVAGMMGRFLNRPVYYANFFELIADEIEETERNIAQMFQSLNESPEGRQGILLLDDLDCLFPGQRSPYASNQNETDRIFAALEKGLLKMDREMVAIATVRSAIRLPEDFVNGFDAVVSFDRYSEEDCVQAGLLVFGRYEAQNRIPDPDRVLFGKILRKAEPAPNPGEIDRMIENALNVVEKHSGMSFYRVMLEQILEEEELDPDFLEGLSFSSQEVARILFPR